MAQQEVWDVARFRKELKKSGPFILPKNIKQTSVKLGRPASSEMPTIDCIESGEGWCRITLAGVIKGLNGSSGLMQQHWGKSRKEKEQFTARIKALNPPQFPGPVRLTYTRHTVRLMDWDNMASTAKHPFDGLKHNKVVVDDSPEYIVEFIPKQFKSRNKDQRTEIFIEAIKAH